MAFIRHKQVNGTTYYSLVESYRDHGRVGQRMIVSLGESPTLDEAIAVEEQRVDLYQRLVNHGRDHWKAHGWYRTRGRRRHVYGGWRAVWPSSLGEAYVYGIYRHRGNQPQNPTGMLGVPVGETAEPYLAKVKARLALLIHCRNKEGSAKNLCAGATLVGTTVNG